MNTESDLDLTDCTFFDGNQGPCSGAIELGELWGDEDLPVYVCEAHAPYYEKLLRGADATARAREKP